MQKNLVIVESPAKAKTIEKFLGNEFRVLSSYGHIRDLKKKSFSIDVSDSFKPDYEVPEDKQALLTTLKKSAKEADVVWLASDEDREGEAIAWHLSEVLNLKPEKIRRIVFHEITEPAIRHAIETPRQIDYNLVDAQQARRILDRIVGFELSPVLWKRIKPNLSAGRVQSVSVRLIVEREREISKFQAESSFRMQASFKLSDTFELHTELNHRFQSEGEAMDFLKTVAKTNNYTIESVAKKPGKRSPSAPFTTSTLQQEASRKLGLPVSRTMSIAQKLYEAGHITYMRTDSLNLSEVALEALAEEITKTWGKENLKTRRYQTKSKGAQEAHEAIRPTYMGAESIPGTAQEKSLYELIRKRTIASQMADAQIERTVIEVPVSGSTHKFIAQGEVITFPGFLSVYHESKDEDHTAASESNATQLLPPAQEGDSLLLLKAIGTERFSRPPARYTEASLVRKMEELGIGRPSTYAPTIQTIQAREYVERGDKQGKPRTYTQITLEDGKITPLALSEMVGQDRGKLIPTDTGTIVNDFLVEQFPSIIDYQFTADVEKQFDRVAGGELEWPTLMETFYEAFHPLVEKASVFEIGSDRIGMRVLGVDPKTGKTVSARLGRYGPMVQIGTADDPDGAKPTFASIPSTYRIESITLDEAILLTSLPKTLGQFEGSDVVVAIGRFGAYAKHGKMFASLPKDSDPYTISLDEAIELIKAKREADAKSLIKTFDEDEKLSIRQGRFGPFIKYDKDNYKLPKDGPAPAEYTHEQCMAIIANAPARKKKAGRTTAKKTSTKKASSTTKKKTASSSKAKPDK